MIVIGENGEEKKKGKKGTTRKKQPTFTGDQWPHVKAVQGCIQGCVQGYVGRGQQRGQPIGDLERCRGRSGEQINDN